MPGKLSIVDIQSVNSFSSLLSELRRLDEKLPGNLDQFVVFNKAYRIITDAIHTAAQSNYFQNPEFIEEFTVHFAHHYFKAINQTLSSDPHLIKNWQTVNEASQHNAPQFMLLLKGANAHINYDLPFTLMEFVSKKQSSSYLKDVLKIDKLLLKSGKHILENFDEPNSFINFVKRQFVFLYYYPVMYLVLSWRINAWRKYRKLRKTAR